MDFGKTVRFLSIITGALASGLLWASSDGLAQPTPFAPGEWLVSVSFPKPASGGSSPQRTSGSGIRDAGGACIARGPGILPMTVLMPLDNVGTTAAANPSLSVYLPRTTAKLAGVVIEDEDFNEVYVKSDFAIPAQLAREPGIVTLNLEGANLKPNKTYTWTFTLICNEGDRSQDRAIEGLFERKELDTNLKTQLEQASPIEQAKLYAQVGIWNETLTLLAQLRSSNPDEWTELLESVELEAIASAPFVE
jgi:Domain of Unknown Function (DUF928)